MILAGRYLSPFTRRVAITLKLMGIPFEHRPLGTIPDADEIRAMNPLGRVPVLVLDTGETLIESSAMLDYLDELAGPERALTPSRGAERRDALRAIAYALGVMEKGIASNYERTRRPEDKRYDTWIEKFDRQTRDGLAVLDAALDRKEWLVAARMTQADIAAVVAYDFIGVVNPPLLRGGGYHRLERLAARCNEMPPFSETRPSL